MKKITLSALMLILSITFCFSQDFITKKNGDEIQAKILEVGNSEIKYKKIDNLEGPTFTIYKSEVLLIKYQNGSKDIFKDEVRSPDTETDFYTNGQSDANIYYRGYSAAGTGTLITALLSPLVGLIPAIACSSAQPREENLDYPSPELMKNPNYYQGYTKKAKKIKQGKIWKNWVIALGVNAIVYVALASSGQ